MTNDSVDPLTSLPASRTPNSQTGDRSACFPVRTLKTPVNPVTVTAFSATKIVTTGPGEAALDYLGSRPR